MTTAVSAVLAVMAFLADRAGRRLDRVGCVPWPLVLVLALLGVLVFGIIALTGRLDLPIGFPSIPRRL